MQPSLTSLNLSLSGNSQNFVHSHRAYAQVHYISCAYMLVYSHTHGSGTTPKPLDLGLNDCCPDHPTVLS